MRTGRVFIAWIAVLGLPCGAAAEGSLFDVELEDHRDWTLSVSAGAGSIDLSGHALVDDRVGDTPVSLNNVLDVDHTDAFWGEIDFQPFRSHHLRVGVTPMRFDGRTVLTASITIDGVMYQAGDQVDTKLRLDQYDVSYRYAFELGDRVTLAPLLQVSILDVRTSIDNETLGVSESERVTLPIPSLGLRAEFFPLARLGLFGEGKALTLGSKATYWELTGGASLHITRNLAILGQYRAADYDIDYWSVDADARLEGPYLAAPLRF
jgi:hypothetical protein